jgi:bifunctional DNA-binding transcriptional regulator/antitoxin component of YhaV-PrlF toxin-antitoxin module
MLSSNIENNEEAEHPLNRFFCLIFFSHRKSRLGPQPMGWQLRGKNEGVSWLRPHAKPGKPPSLQAVAALEKTVELPFKAAYAHKQEMRGKSRMELEGIALGAPMIDNATIMSKGQVTMPKEARSLQKAAEGDRPAFICGGECAIRMNASIYATRTLQGEIKGGFEKAGANSEEGIIALCRVAGWRLRAYDKGDARRKHHDLRGMQPVGPAFQGVRQSV